MKKMLVLLLVCAFSASVFADWNVYDYRASFKRVNDTLRWFTLSSGRKKLDTATVTSDTFKGYLALKQCDACTAVGITAVDHSFIGVDNYADDASLNRAIIYLTRGGEKTQKRAGKPVVLRSYANVDYAMFGSKTSLVAGEVVGSNPNKSWLTMEYDVAVPALIAGEGFLGLANTNVVFDGLSGRARVAQAGFGAVRTETTYSSCDQGSCLTLVNASGSLVGEFAYSAVCSAGFMLDVCSPITAVLYAPISGTWSLKLNKSVTSLVAGLTGPTAATVAPLNAVLDANTNGVNDEVFGVTFPETSFDAVLIKRLTGVSVASKAQVIYVKPKRTDTDGDYFFN